MSDELAELFSKTLTEIKSERIVVNDTASSGTSITSEQADKFPKVKTYAFDQTKKELEQAVEGMYHNLNTLN